MNANIKGILQVKADRVNDRIQSCANTFINRYGDNIGQDTFKEFVRLTHIIITTELNEKGDERRWKN